MKELLLLFFLLFFFSGCVDQPTILLKQDANVSDINVMEQCTGEFGLAASGVCYSFAGAFGGGDLNQLDANIWFWKQNDLNAIIQIRDFNNVWVAWLDGNKVYWKQSDLNKVLQIPDFNKVYYSQKDVNNLFLKLVDVNQAGRFDYTVIANAPWITVASADTNWQTSWWLLDANLALKYYTQLDANNIFMKKIDWINVDGGFADSIYLPLQAFDGGSANSTYSTGQSLDGGDAT